LLYLMYAWYKLCLNETQWEVHISKYSSMICFFVFFDLHRYSACVLVLIDQGTFSKHMKQVPVVDAAALPKIPIADCLDLFSIYIYICITVYKSDLRTVYKLCAGGTVINVQAAFNR
jgi:hypothetical protein